MTNEFWGAPRNMPEPDNEEDDDEDEENPDEETVENEFEALLTRYWQKLQEKTL